MSAGSLVRRTDLVLRPDPARVVNLPFLPGTEIHGAGVSRRTAVLQRLSALPESEVATALDDVLRSFDARHDDLTALLDSRFALVASDVADVDSVSPARRLLIGASMSQEYAIESAAVFNPSMVPHPDQSGLPAGTTRFLMSVRGVGEGHVSCAELRTGTIDAADRIAFDVPGPTTTVAARDPVEYVREDLRRQNAEVPGDPLAVDAFLAALPERFGEGALAGADDRLSRLAASTYALRYPPGSAVDSRVLLPQSPAERQGVEDVRLVRFSPTQGPSTYLGTYTAFDGSAVAPHLLATDDFTTFRMSPLSGPGAKNKGLALFPRPVGGRYLALSRWDRENNSLAASSDLQHWDDVGTLRSPDHAWELVQAGNCGSPLETSAGWLVLTHGVGPMRVYSIGAMLLDLDDPSRVIGNLHTPLLAPSADERDGYVPNVVYTCGAMLHGDTLVVPYGCSDTVIRVALVDLQGLLAAMRP